MAIKITGHPALGYHLTIDGVDEQLVGDVALERSLYGHDVIKLALEHGLYKLADKHLKKES